MLGNNFTVKNFGVGGSAVTHNSSKPYMNQVAFLKALDFDPDVVIIMLGTNDANNNNSQNIPAFSSDYQKLINRFSDLPGKEQIWLVEPPPILENSLNLSDTNLVQGVIPQIQQVAATLSLPTIDMHSAMLNYTEYIGDGVHPDSNGASFIANGIENAISSGFDQYGQPIEPIG